MSLSVGAGVRIVDRHKGWTVGETQLYGGMRGVVVGLHTAYKAPHNILVRLDEGECAGECRWFRESELVTESSHNAATTD